MTDGLQQSLFARDVAIETVEAHADDDWMHTAWRVVLGLARTQEEFTSDDVWALLAYEPAFTHEPRALGAIMVRVGRERVAYNTGRTTRSRFRRRHARPVAIWHSNLYRSSA